MKSSLKIAAIIFSMFVVACLNGGLGFAAEEITEEPVVESSETIAEEPIVESPEVIAEEPTSELSGMITAVDIEKSIIVVENAKQVEGEENESLTFSIDDNTAIEKSYLKAVLGDLVVGDKVNIEYKVDSQGENVALFILASEQE